MKRLTAVALPLLGIFILNPSVHPQEKPGKEETKTAATQQEGPQARVQIVFTEYDGERKIKSLPYTLLVRVGAEGKDGPWSKIRMGSRVPVATGGAKGAYDFQYIDVGTNIDCTASSAPDGRYRLSLTMERSWVEAEATSDGKSVPANTEARVGEFREPVIRQFRSDSSVSLREGQTLETNFATDPVSGKVIKLEVSLNLVK
jgi:hypothetical protein